MFLVAITKDGITNNFKSFKVEESNLHFSKITAVTDGFLSEFITESNGFSVIESPLISTYNSDEIIFSKLTYDSQNDSLTVLNSMMFGRPLYYYVNSKDGFFCSTNISLLRSAGVPIEENTDVLPEFFVYRNIMAPNTMFKDIYQLPCECQLKIKIIDETCFIKPIIFYNPPKKNKKIKSVKESSNKLYSLISESIKKLKIYNDVTAVFLSGGIDSSVISSICKLNFITDTSYSTEYPFEEPIFNIEKENALSASQTLGMKHYHYSPTNQDYITGFLEAISKAEEPLHHLQSVLLHLLIKKGIDENKKILINGQGMGTIVGDNYFLYTQNKRLFKLLSKNIPLGVLKVLSKIFQQNEKYIEIMNKSIYKYDLSNPKNPIWSWMDYGSKIWVCNYFNVTEYDIIKNRYNIIKNFQNLSVNDIWSIYSLFSDEQNSLSIWGKIGEGNKKIIYFPYYDLSILNYAFSIPSKIKFHRPWGVMRKEIARRANIPEFIIDRPKSSFSIKSKHWSENNGIFEPLVPLASKVIDEKEIRKMQSPIPKKAMIYWNILNYSIWKRLLINNEPLEVLLEELKEYY